MAISIRLSIKANIARQARITDGYYKLALAVLVQAARDATNTNPGDRQEALGGSQGNYGLCYHHRLNPEVRDDRD